MYTQRGRRRHKMCGVWSPLISDRLQATYLSFFFMKPICLPCVASPLLICQFAICRSVAIWWRQSKHANTFFSKWQTRRVLESWNFKCQRGKKWHFHRVKSWEHISRSLFSHSRILLQFISHSTMNYKYFRYMFNMYLLTYLLITQRNKFLK